MKTLIILILSLLVLPASLFAGDSEQSPAVIYKGDPKSGERPYASGLLFRGYYFNDHRLINGLESTFAAEGIVNFKAEEPCSFGKVLAVGEFYLNQPLSKNVSKNQTRSIYTTVYDPDPFEVSELYLGLENSSFSLKLGKARTPFGRYYFPVYSNSRFDAPFIRAEAVLWKETGLIARYHPNAFSFELAVTNGEQEKDTNSSKAVIARLGWDDRDWALGISGKIQDGKGSEYLKVYNNHAGLDFMLRSGRVTFSGEVIYDEYGCVNAECANDPERISLYHRDVLKKKDTPITGVGGYLDIFYQGKMWDIDLNYGMFQPEKIGNPYHDDPIHRWLLKAGYSISPCMDAFFAGLLENERTTDESRGTRNAHNNYAFIVGLQYKV